MSSDKDFSVRKFMEYGCHISHFARLSHDGRWDGMMDKANAYVPKRGGAVVEDTVYGFDIIVHHPANTNELEKRVAQAHADAIIAKVKKLNCSARQKKELIDAICV